MDTTAIKALTAMLEGVPEHEVQALISKYVGNTKKQAQAMGLRLKTKGDPVSEDTLFELLDAIAEALEALITSEPARAAAVLQALVRDLEVNVSGLGEAEADAGAEEVAATKVRRRTMEDLVAGAMRAGRNYGGR